jgi:hypothetical protein
MPQASNPTTRPSSGFLSLYADSSGEDSDGEGVLYFLTPVLNLIQFIP